MSRSASPPKLIVPSPRRDTWMPVDPNATCCICTVSHAKRSGKSLLSRARDGTCARHRDAAVWLRIARAKNGLIGLVVDGHRLSSELGSGGSGVVFRAICDESEACIAVKVLRSKHSSESDAGKRFLREATLEDLRHPNIVEVRSAGFLTDPSNGRSRPYLTMELLRGESLDERIERDGAQAIGDTVRIIGEVLDGLSAAHEAGVVHRDVKPANVFLSREGDAPEVAKLLDFSVARVAAAAGATVTATGDIVGTPLYLAPEQATGVKGQDERVDLWAAGVLLYQMLTGQPPFATQQLAELILKIVSENPPPPTELRPEIPAALEAVVQRALRKPVAERFTSAREMAAALRSCV